MDNMHTSQQSPSVRAVYPLRFQKTQLRYATRVGRIDERQNSRTVCAFCVRLLSLHCSITL